MLTVLFFALALILVIKSANFALRFASRLAEGLNISKYLIGFLLVAILSVLPEGFIAISSALQGTPAFGLGTLFGSNVADLTLIFALVVFVSGRALKVESKIIKHNLYYLLTLVIPLAFGLDGYYSRTEGLLLIIIGFIFYYFLLRGKDQIMDSGQPRYFSVKNFWLLLISMAVLLIGSNFTVKYGVELAQLLNLSPTLIAMLFVGLGTTLPELFFSIKAVKNNRDSLALGDILGTVITDAVLLVGFIAILKPFAFNSRIVYVTGLFMVVAAIILLYCLKTGHNLSRKEALFLLFYYLIFILVEFTLAQTFAPSL